MRGRWNDRGLCVAPNRLRSGNIARKPADPLGGYDSQEDRQCGGSKSVEAMDSRIVSHAAIQDPDGLRFDRSSQERRYPGRIRDSKKPAPIGGQGDRPNSLNVGQSSNLLVIRMNQLDIRIRQRGL